MNQWPVNALSAFVGVGGFMQAGRGANRVAAEAGPAPVQQVSAGVRGKGAAAGREVDGDRGRADFRREMSWRAELSGRVERFGAVERVSRGAALERVEEPEGLTGDRGELPEGGAKGEIAPRLAVVGAGVRTDERELESESEVPGAVVTEAEPEAVQGAVEVRPTGATSDERAEGSERLDDGETVDGGSDARHGDGGTEGAVRWMSVRVEADAVEVVVSEGVMPAVPEARLMRVGGGATLGAVSAGVTGVAVAGLAMTAAKVTAATVVEAGGAETAGGQTGGGQTGEQRSDQPKAVVLEAFRQEMGAGQEVRPGRWETLTRARPGAEGRQEAASQGDGTGETGHGTARLGPLGVSAGLTGSSGLGMRDVQPMVVEAKPWAGVSDEAGGASPVAKLGGVTAAAVGPGSGTTLATGTPKVDGASPLSYAPETRFHAANGPGILQSVRAQLLPNGGTMTMRLDPPEMGALQVAVVLKDGLASVTFRAENPEAVRLLSQTMAQLRETLSAAGLTVDRMQVQQGSRQEGTGGSGGSGTGQGGTGPGSGAFQMQDEQARREQQRRELLERLWLKAAGVDSGVMA